MVFSPGAHVREAGCIATSMPASCSKQVGQRTVRLSKAALAEPTYGSCPLRVTSLTSFCVPTILQIAALRMDVQRLTRGKRAAEAQAADLRKELAAAQVRLTVVPGEPSSVLCQVQHGCDRAGF